MLSFKDTRDFLLLSYDMKLITDDEFWSSFRSGSLLLYFPPFDLNQLNEDECSAQLLSVPENRVLLFFFFSISAFFDKAEVIYLTGKQHYDRNSIHPRLVCIRYLVPLLYLFTSPSAIFDRFQKLYNVAEYYYLDGIRCS